ncbi:MAG TPA: universal stress protein [bacterium]|nr:universal stress protein [bacterium]
MFKKILIATDGSEYSVRAAEVAFDLAKKTDARVLVLSVIDAGVLGDFSGESEKERARVERDMRLAAEGNVEYVLRLGAEVGVGTTGHVLTGRPNIEIVNLTNNEAVDLIVLGRHRRRSIGRIMKSDLAVRLMEDLDCSVLVVV